MTTAAVTVDATLETDGTLVYTGGGGIDTFTGGSGADNITGGSGADIITGKGGADIINLGSGDSASDIVKFTATGDFGDTINQFEEGAGGDTIDFLTSLLVNGSPGSTLLELTATTGTIGVNDVFIELGGGNFTSTTTNTAAGAATVISALTDTNIDSGDKMVIAMDNDTNTYLWYYQEDGGDTTTAVSGELTLIATISGLADAVDLGNGDLTIT